MWGLGDINEDWICEIDIQSIKLKEEREKEGMMKIKWKETKIMIWWWQRKQKKGGYDSESMILIATFNFQHTKSKLFCEGQRVK